MTQVRKRIYFAAPLFTSWERRANYELTKRLEEEHSVYLPQRDGLLLADELAAGSNRQAVATEVYLGDCAAIKSADVLVAVLSGPSIDDGVAFEIGYAAALRIPCVGLMDDSRRAGDYFQNPMWRGALDAECANSDELVEAIRLVSLRTGGRSNGFTHP